MMKIKPVNRYLTSIQLHHCVKYLNQFKLSSHLLKASHNIARDIEQTRREEVGDDKILYDIQIWQDTLIGEWHDNNLNIEPISFTFKQPIPFKYFEVIDDSKHLPYQDEYQFNSSKILDDGIPIALHNINYTLFQLSSFSARARLDQYWPFHLVVDIRK